MITSWDDGIVWHTEQTPEQAPDLDTYDSLTLAFVRDQHLKAANGSSEDAYIQQLIRTSYRYAERMTRRSLIPQRRTLVTNMFPSGSIFFPFPNLLAVESAVVLDGDGNETELAGSPDDGFQVKTPSGPTAARGSIWPLYGQSWPTSGGQGDAVRIVFESGYPIVDGVAQIPEDINQGRLLIIGELYKQRSESVHAFNQNPALVRARDFFSQYRAY